jgi:hypothetical protein
MENLDLVESLGYQDMSSDKNSTNSRSYSKEDFMIYYGNISNDSEDTWKSGLELYDDEKTIFSLGSNRDTHWQHQVYAIIDDTSDEFDSNNNPIINPANVRRGANHMEEGDTAESITSRRKVQLTVEEWDAIKVAVNNSAAIPVDARPEVLLGYLYAHMQLQQLEKRKVKSGKGESQSVWQAKHTMQKEAMHHTQIAEGTTDMDLGCMTSSTPTEGIYHKTSTHLSYQSMSKGTLYQRHLNQHL